MFSIFCMLAIKLLVTEAQPAPADVAVTGRWEGIVQVRAAVHEIDFSVEVRPVADGKLGGSITFLTQDDPPQPLDSVKVNGNEVTITTHDPQGVVSSFQGRLAADGTMSGELAEGDGRYPFSAHRQEHPSVAPAGNLQDLAPTGANLVDLFNKDRGKVRLVAILSPTCPMCKNGSRILERYVLERISDPNLRVYIVWENIRTDDSRQHALKSAAFAADPRVTNFWSEKRVMGEAFKEKVGFKTSPAWDVFLLFPAGTVWEKGAVPTPSELMCNLMGSPEDSAKLPRFNGAQLQEQVKAMLAKSQASAGLSTAGAAVDKRQHPN
jgi:hypothetical protein